MLRILDSTLVLCLEANVKSEISEEHGTNRICVYRMRTEARSYNLVLFNFSWATEIHIGQLLLLLLFFFCFVSVDMQESLKN